MHPQPLDSFPHSRPALPSGASLLSGDHMDNSLKGVPSLALPLLYRPHEQSHNLPFYLHESRLSGNGQVTRSHGWVTNQPQPFLGGGCQSAYLSLVSSFLHAPNFTILLKPTQLPSPSFSAENLNSFYRETVHVRLGPSQASFQPSPSAVSPKAPTTSPVCLSPLIAHNKCPPAQSLGPVRASEPSPSPPKLFPMSCPICQALSSA